MTPTIVVGWYIMSGKAKCLTSMFTEIMASWPPLSHKKIINKPNGIWLLKIFILSDSITGIPLSPS